MASYLGPESPRPLAVISESYQNRYKIPVYEDFENFNFGDKYQEQMYKMIHKYLELETVDKLCYVGDNKGSMAYLLQEKFVLLEPVTTVIPGHFHYAETNGHKLVPIRIAHVGAEEYFRQAARENKYEKKHVFTKVILQDVVRYFTNPVQVYENILKCLDKNGKILIIHRAGNLTTLPYFKDAKDRFADNEVPYLSIIKNLQACKMDVQWDLECLPIVMPKKKWFSMMQQKFPPQMDLLSDFEITTGVRELSEGVLKYEGDMVEFVDRLLFITATPSRLENGLPSVERYGASDLVPFPTVRDLKLTMNLTPDLTHLIKVKETTSKKRDGFGSFPWS